MVSGWLTSVVTRPASDGRLVGEAELPHDRQLVEVDALADELVTVEDEVRANPRALEKPPRRFCPALGLAVSGGQRNSSVGDCNHIKHPPQKRWPTTQ